MAHFQSLLFAFLAVLIAVLFEVSSRIDVNLSPLDLSCKFSELDDFDVNTDLRSVYVIRATNFNLEVAVLSPYCSPITRIRTRFRTCKQNRHEALLCRLHSSREAVGTAHAPETIVLNSKGDVYMFCEDGWVRSLAPDGRAVKTYYIGGRPLGGAFDQNDNLIVAEPTKGLCMIIKQAGKYEQVALRRSKKLSKHSRLVRNRCTYRTALQTRHPHTYGN